MGNFLDVFSFSGGDEPDEDGQIEFVQPPWIGPPDDELGVALPQAVVIGRSDRGVIALKRLTVYSNGVMLDLTALARGLRDAEANRLFHEHHLADPDDEIRDGFIRVGIEYEDQTRVSNLGDRRRLFRSDHEPDGPVLMPSGGGGGQAGGGRVSINPGYWLWPLPPAASLTLFVEWPALAIPLSRTELDGKAIAEAALRSGSVWTDSS